MNAPLSRDPRRVALPILASLALAAGLLLGLKDRPAEALQVKEPPTIAGRAQDGALVVTHVGVGSPPTVSDGAEKAAKAGMALLAAAKADEDSAALRAAVTATVSMEDDPRYNAGTGSNIRLDGKTIQMDASLMTEAGRFAAVGVIERVKNPILVVEKILETPHLFMAGAGATRFAHRAGFADVIPTSAPAQAKYRKRMKRLGQLVNSGKAGFDWRQYWNFPGEMPADMKAWRHGGDTVGTVVRSREGRFAATLSTGGTSVTLHGRVGDVPVYGAGCYAGPAGATACTGHGEEIIKRFMAKTVYETMAKGGSAREAVRAAVLDFPEASSLGLIAVGRKGWGVAANRSMAYGMAGANP